MDTYKSHLIVYMIIYLYGNMEVHIRSIPCTGKRGLWTRIESLIISCCIVCVYDHDYTGLNGFCLLALILPCLRSRLLL